MCIVVDYIISLALYFFHVPETFHAIMIILETKYEIPHNLRGTILKRPNNHTDMI